MWHTQLPALKNVQLDTCVGLKLGIWSCNGSLGMAGCLDVWMYVVDVNRVALGVRCWTEQSGH